MKKKIVLTLLAVGLISGITSCNSNKNPTIEPDNPIVDPDNQDDKKDNEDNKKDDDKKDDESKEDEEDNIYDKDMPYSLKEYTDEAYSNYYQTTLDKMYSLEDGTYYYYIFNYDCGACNAIKSNILGYVESNLKTTNLYFVDLKELRKNGNTGWNYFKSPEGSIESAEDFQTYIEKMKENKPNKVSDTYIYFVPYLVKVTNNYFENAYVGTNDIIQELKANL